MSPSELHEVHALLTIAGTDPCGAAGIQVDLQVFRDHGFHGLSAISAVVAQNTSGVRAYEPVSQAIFQGQLDALLEDIPFEGVKIGMLPTARSIEEVGQFLDRRRPPFVVLDPVLASGDGGHALSAAGALEALVEVLVPRVSVLTPNVAESSAILGRPLATLDDLLLAAEDLCRLGCPGVLLKAGHLPHRGSDDLIRDVWADHEGALVLEGLERIEADVRGTGCQLSSALLCGLAEGRSPREAAQGARGYLNRLLRTRVARPGRGRPLVIR